MTESNISNRWAWRRRKDIFTNHHVMTELINDKAVYRTAPATPGLVIDPRDPRSNRNALLKEKCCHKKNAMIKKKLRPRFTFIK